MRARPILPVLATALLLAGCTGTRNEGQRRQAQAEAQPARAPVTEQPYVASPGEHFLRQAEDEQARAAAAKAEQAAQNAARAGVDPARPAAARPAPAPLPAPMPPPAPAPLPAPEPMVGGPRPGICDAPSVLRFPAPQAPGEAAFTRQAPAPR